MTADIPRELAQQAADRLAAASGVRLPLLDAPPAGPVVSLMLATEHGKFPTALKVDAAMFRQLGEQGYALAVEKGGVTLAARTVPGLRYGITTLAQIAADRTTLPGMIIRDWPSLRYRGVQQDISRGQVPTPETLKRLADVLAEGKMNQLELYIEHVYKYKAFPRHLAPGGIGPGGVASELALHAARQGVEVHPLLQVLGHSYSHSQQTPVPAPAHRTLRKNAVDHDLRHPQARSRADGDQMVDELCEIVPGRTLQCGHHRDRHRRAPSRGPDARTRSPISSSTMSCN